MNRIDIERVDKLNELIYEIEAINYINGLVQGDTVDRSYTGLSRVQQSAIYFISERYEDVVARLYDYVNSDSFNRTEEDSNV